MAKYPSWCSPIGRLYTYTASALPPHCLCTASALPLALPPHACSPHDCYFRGWSGRTMFWIQQCQEGFFSASATGEFVGQTVGCYSVKITFEQLALEAAVINKSPDLTVNVIEMIWKVLCWGINMYTNVGALWLEQNIAVRDDDAARWVITPPKDELVDQSSQGAKRLVLSSRRCGCYSRCMPSAIELPASFSSWQCCGPVPTGELYQNVYFSLLRSRSWDFWTKNERLLWRFPTEWRNRWWIAEPGWFKRYSRSL